MMLVTLILVGLVVAAPAHSAVPAPACSASELFHAAVNKEHFNANDPSYAGFGHLGNHPGAYGVICDRRWAVALISRPNVGTTDGETLFRAKSGSWFEIAQLGAGVVECVVEPHGVPAAVASVLAHGVKGSGEAGCDAPDAYGGARLEWKTAVCDSAAQQTYDYREIADYLQQAQPAYAGNPAGYKAAIRELTNLASIPETGTTNAQQEEQASDIKQLDVFFQTPKLYVTVVQCPLG